MPVSIHLFALIAALVVFAIEAFRSKSLIAAGLALMASPCCRLSRWLRTQNAFVL